MTKTAWYLIGFMGLIIIILSIVIIFRKPVDTITPFNDKPFQDSIIFLLKDNENLHNYNDSLTHIYDSVTSLERSTTIRYYEKLIFLKGASTDDLDNYIRHNW